jgi:hypothetical protein
MENFAFHFDTLCKNKFFSLKTNSMKTQLLQ